MASIKERNGKYCVIYHYTDPDGKKKQKWETFITRKQAEERKAEIEYKEKRGLSSFLIAQLWISC